MNTTILLIKSWFAQNGFEGIIGLVAGVALLILGFKFAGGIAIGVFASKNWDIIKTYVMKLIAKNKIEAIEVKEVKDEVK